MGLGGHDFSSPEWSDRYLKSVYSAITTCWGESVRGTEYGHLLTQALAPGKLRLDHPDRSPRKWAPILPFACCQAAGGEPETAIPVAAAWLVFYLAAHTLDAIADGDEPDPWWSDLGPGPALNVATGLLISGPLVLNVLHDNPATESKAALITGEFFQHVLRVAAGQHRDLTVERLDLPKWWEIAEAKAGDPFSLACKAGSMLGTAGADTETQLSRFGRELGLLIQILDDVLDLQTWSPLENSERRTPIDRLLPAVYALEVLPPTKRGRLRSWLAQGISDPEAAQAAYQEINLSGVAVYLTTEIRKHRQNASQALQNARITGPASTWLNTIIDEENIPGSLIA